MKDDQLTLRLPHDLLRDINRRARELRVPKAQVVREALTAYFAGPAEQNAAGVWPSVAPMIGSLELDPRAIERDQIAGRVRRHNWRA
jgi:hypothetical protein